MSTGALANTSTDGNHSHSLSGTAASAGAHAHTVGIGAHTHSVAIGSHGHTITVNAAGNAENTVKNIAFNYIHMDTPSPLTLLVTRKTPSKTSHLTIL
ncbi:hypothetical protein O5173_06935 [Escherichia coli]|nr:hypothetical protein [Escherichia coli]